VDRHALTNREWRDRLFTIRRSKMSSERQEQAVNGKYFKGRCERLNNNNSHLFTGGSIEQMES